LGWVDPSVSHPAVRGYNRHQRRIPLLTLPLIFLLALQALTAPVANLKTVELADKYEIQVPDYLTARRISDHVVSVPAYVFNAAPPRQSTIQVFVKPYVEVRRSSDGVAVTTAAVKPGAKYFTISGNRRVYYSWSVVDNAYECSMNSPCPLNWPVESRYAALYDFTIFDKPNNSVIEFTGEHYGRSKEVTGFEGDGKLLHDVIIPSLTAIH
jgi:hypothetical protein